MYSHSIGKELIKMGDADPEFLRWVKKESGVLNNWTGELDVVYDWFKNDKIKKSIFEHVSENVDTFNVIGGEPTVISEFFELLEYCNKRGTLANKDIGICTNVTNVNPRLTDWLPALRNFTIFPSVDGVGDRQEYIRYPSRWSKIVENLNFYHSIIKKSNKGCINFQPAIQVLNIDMLDSMIDFFLSYEKTNISFVSYVQYPLICNYHFLPQDYKEMVAEKLLNATKKYTLNYIQKELEAHAHNLSTGAMDKQRSLFLMKAFIKYNDFQDNFRKRSTWRQLLPDLEKSLTASLK